MKLFSVLVLSLTLLFGSCTKSEGIGGKSVITGKITVTNIDNGVSEDTYSAQEHDVYIIYGDGSVYNDDFKTSLDGTFQFEYLNKGSYQIFTYGDCDDCPKGQDSLILVPIELEKNEIKDVGTIEVYNYI